MTLRIAVAGVLLLAGSATWAGETVFPSDSKPPEHVRDAELLEVVCPAGFTAGEAMECRSGCPPFTGFGTMKNLPWSVGAVTRGHFLSAISDDAVLWMNGCEAHHLNFGGAALLTQHGKKWSMLWYKAGVQTERCHKTPLRGGREVLVCIGTAGAQGNNVTDLYVEDLLSPKPVLMATTGEEETFLAAFDDTANCGANAEDEVKTFPLIRSHIDAVAFLSNRSGETPDLSVTASFGERAVTPAEVKVCESAPGKILPPTKTYRMKFRFDGHTYRATPGSAGAARILGAR